MTEDDIIEAIARQWFLTKGNPPSRAELWDKLPDDMKRQHRNKAREFFMKPSRPYEQTRDLLYRLDGMLVDYRRGIGVVL